MDGTLGQLDTAFEIATQFDGNLKGSLWATFGPSLLCVSGVFFFHFRILSAIILYNASLAAGVGNAMLPWFTERIKNEAASDAQTSLSDSARALIPQEIGDMNGE